MINGYGFPGAQGRADVCGGNRVAISLTTYAVSLFSARPKP